MTPVQGTARCTFAFFTALIALLAPGCNNDGGDASPENENAPGNTDSNATASKGGGAFPHADWLPSDDPTRIVSHGLEFNKPVTWMETPPLTTLRSANYTIPGVPRSLHHPGGDAAELVLFHMNAGEAMTIDQHVERWLMQFEPLENGDKPAPDRTTVDAGDQSVPIVELKGSYVKSGSAWFTPGQAMIAAILETPPPVDASGGAGQLIIRLTGPQATVEANRDTFLSMIASVRPARSPGRADTPPTPP